MTTCLFSTLSLLAEAENSSFGSVVRTERARASWADALPWLIGGAAIVIVYGTYRFIRSRLGHEGGGYHPRKLFQALCKAHGLEPSQVRLLLMLARAKNLPQPSDLFLQPALLEAGNLGPECTAQAAAIESLRTRLFAK